MTGQPMPGVLYVVSTPIGNMDDLSHRAVAVLQSVDAVLAEDTRHTRPLLDRFGIRAPLESYHAHNEARTVPRLVGRLLAGARLALVADAGTPLLSDPGARLVRAAIDADVPVVPVPGASALLAALVASGLDAARFTFYGFLPRKGRERREALEQVSTSAHTSVIYEAPTRLAATLADLAGCGAAERRVAVARELTKQFEEIRRGTAAELARYYEEFPPRGEIVIVLEGAPEVALDEGRLREEARALRAAGASPREVARKLVHDHGVSRNTAYRLAHER